jgi:streptomycin 6-kinase
MPSPMGLKPTGLNPIGGGDTVPTVIELPPGVRAFADRGEDWAGFVDRLPKLTSALIEEWQLTLDGTPTHGYCALVLPVRTTGGRPAMLKIGFPDDESEHEPLALQHWHGNGAVELLRADPHRSAMLLERLHREDLTDLWDLEACEIVAAFYRRLHVPAPPQLRTLTSYIERWGGGLAELPRNAPIPRRLVEQALALGRDFVADPASTGTMIHTDLHYENVLAADREPWLVIDPKPVSGDPHYELAPMLWNRMEELEGDLRNGLRRRFHTLIDTAELDEHRARDWVVVRMVHNALFRLQDPPETTRITPTDAYLTDCIAIAKAVQD